MKEFFKKMKGKLAGKKGSSLIAVMTTMAVLSIVALCAAGIALTNYRTTQTYTSQDNYYYSAEAGQAQYVSNINDEAYNIASQLTWDYDNATSYKTNASTVYNTVIEKAETFQTELDNVLYNNGEYKVKNEIVDSEISDDYSECIITIKTTVTAVADGSTQEFTSTATVKCPTKGDETSGSSSSDFITITVDKNEPLFNNGYSLVTNGSGKNTDWYGLWAGFNTVTTMNNKTAPYIGNGHTTSKNLNAAGKVFTTESTSPSSSLNSGIMMKAAISESVANNPSKGSYINHVHPDSTFNGEASRLDKFFNGIDINITGVIDSAKDSEEVKNVTGDKITLAFGDSIMSKEEKFYAKYDGNFTIGFAVTPKDKGTVSVDTLPAGTFDGTQPAYRVVCDKNGKNFGIGYKYKSSNGRLQSSVPYSYTYADHYYKNKWFFIDLNGTGTLFIDNSTTTERAYDKNVEWRWGLFGWHLVKTITNYTTQDGWGIDNYVNFGNIVMEDCYFFVNGNISIANGYNMSNCKFFATGDILLESVYYLEGLLSLETEAGSTIIEQSLYYTDGVFRSNLISRYAMAWVVDNDCSNMGALLFYGGFEYKLYRPSGNDVRFTDWQDEWIECSVPNENSYQVSGKTGLYYGRSYSYTTNGYLATYRYPTVLKATIIAKGTTSFTPKQSTTNGKVNKSPSAVDGVSVIFSPDGMVDGVVDAVLVEGQVFAKGKTYTCNYNGDSENGKYYDRYAASSQIQYQPYTGGYEGIGDNTPLEEVFTKIETVVNEGIKSTTYSPIIIENSGIAKM